MYKHVYITPLAVIPSFSEMAAPLTDLLKASGPGTRRIAWSVECDTAFNMLKTTLTSAPVLRHFNPDLRTAVHIDGFVVVGTGFGAGFVYFVFCL